MSLKFTKVSLLGKCGAAQLTKKKSGIKDSDFVRLRRILRIATVANGNSAVAMCWTAI